MIVKSAFRPAWWARNAHAQTLLAATVFKGRAKPVLHRETLELPDGDFLHLDWTAPLRADQSKRIVLLIHGLEGSSRSPYAASVMQAVQQRGWQGVVMHFRGCTGVPNRLPRTYHAAETSDIALVIDTLHRRYPQAHLAAVGYSLGGSVLLKHLGEQNDATLTCAAAVSVSFDLDASARVLARGMARLYQYKLLRSLRRTIKRKYTAETAPFDMQRALKAKTFHEFDDAVTAPLHGFDGVDHYYRVASSAQYLPSIRIPTLIVDAVDDPFMSPDTIPDESALSESITLELSPHGGHVGFIEGDWPWRPRFWLDGRVLDYIQEQFEAAEADVRDSAAA